MLRTTIATPRSVLALTCLLAIDAVQCEEPAAPPAAAQAPASAAADDAIPRLSLEKARERAELMHEIYSASLDAMHERYFHGDKAVVPARAMEDVFRDIEDRTHSQARWISASFTAMSLDHEPKSEFEKLAAKRLAKGTAVVETIEAGYYRRAGGIPLTSGCISCHSGMFGGRSPAKRFAGLVISIPIEAGAKLPHDEATAATETGASTETSAENFPANSQRVTVEEARRQAALLHTAMHSALQLTHHRFYKEDEGLPIPAAVVREMFDDVHADHAARLRWLVVEGQAMNTDHQARTPFEHAAVAALKSGQGEYEETTDGVYRRAASIRLQNACLKCHVPDRKSTEDRTAGLIVAIPVLGE
jgi:hypothetical protein